MLCELHAEGAPVVIFDVLKLYADLSREGGYWGFIARYFSLNCHLI